MAICVLIALVVVVIVFDVGSGAHKNAGLFTLDGVKHPMSNSLDLGLLLQWDLSADLFEGADFLNLIGLGWKGLFSSLYSSSNASIFFLRMERASLPTPGAAGDLLNCMIFPICVNTFDHPHCYFYVYSVLW